MELHTHRRVRGWSLLGLASALAASGLVLGSTAPAPAAGDPRIVLQREVFGGESQILLSNSRGTWTRRLTPLRSVNALPRWGPQGHRIMYTRASAEGIADTDLMVMGARGRHKRVLLPGRDRNQIQNLAWAPGAHRAALVMTRFDSATAWDLWVLTLATGQLRKLNVKSQPDQIITAVDWSSTGTIAFSASDASSPNEHTDLYTVRPNGSGLRRLTHTPARYEGSPRFSPNGRQLVYATASGRCKHLVVANSDGTNQRRTGGCRAFAASWTPNSRRLLVERYGSSDLEIWDTSIDGSSQRFIVAGTNAGWRPR